MEPRITFEIKRKEEQIKYTLNWCFRFLEKRLEDSIKKQDKKVSLDFYSYYFKDVCKEHNLKIETFYKPSFTKNSKLTTRSFKKDYLRMLKLSDKFMSDSELAFEDYFMEHQKAFVVNRLNKIFDKLRIFLAKKANEEECFDQKLIRFLNETNLQLPWTISQVHESSKTIKEIFFENDLL